MDQEPEHTSPSQPQPVEPRQADISDSPSEDVLLARVQDEVPGLPHLPITQSMMDSDEVKPSWRGWIHAVTFPLAVVAGIVLIVLADGTAATVSSTVFVTTSMLLFGNSALYHRFNWKPVTKRVLKRIDHANIFLLIAGTYTPLAVLCLPTNKAILLLSCVWGGALLGIGFRVFWIGAPRWLYVPIYLLLGWAAMMYVVDFLQANVTAMILIMVGGLCYTAGAIFYGIKKPNPIPGVFGFHEIFHSLTVIAFACHYVAILLVSTNPPLV